MIKIRIISIWDFLDFLTKYSTNMVSFQIQGDQKLWAHLDVKDVDQIAMFRLIRKEYNPLLPKKDCNSLIKLIKGRNLDKEFHYVSFVVQSNTYIARETYYTIQNDEIIITIMKD